MKRYKVTVREIAEQDVFIEVESEDDAIMAVYCLVKFRLETNNGKSD